MLPLPIALTLAFIVGLIAGAAVNWAAYSRAFNPRAISPWSRPHPDAPRRRASDRIPMWGWLGLRREATVHGRGFWVRPLAVELLMGAGYAALYWWEVVRQGLLDPQFQAIAVGRLPAGLGLAPEWITLATFASHAVLIALMAAVSLIDIDEKLIPDDITIPGTLVGLVLAAMAPMSLLPHAAAGAVVPAVAVSTPLPARVANPDGPMYVEPTALTAPIEWPSVLNGAGGLVVGLACFALWGVALTPRIWRGRRGLAFGLKVLSRRVLRELARPPLAWIGLVGALGIAAVWWLGGAHWVGLLTALVGMIGGAAMVWAVRIVGSAALRREAMGFGDVTLMMMVGSFLGWQAGIFIFFLAPFAGLVVGVATVVLRRDNVIAFVPYLCLAAVAVIVMWGHIWNARFGGIQGLFGVPWLVPAMLAVCVVMLGATLVLWRNIKEAIF